MYMLSPGTNSVFLEKQAVLKFTQFTNCTSIYQYILVHDIYLMLVYSYDDFASVKIVDSQS